MKNLNEFNTQPKVLGTHEPIGLRKLPDQLATSAAVKGDQKFDKVPSSEVKYPVSQLRPAQKEVITHKALAFALGYLKVGKPDLTDMEAIISNDNPPYIMDGHHRWAAATLVDPNMQVKVYKVNIGAGPLISALNVYTKGILKQAGNKGKGDIEQWKGDIPVSIDRAVQSGLLYWPLGTEEDVQAGDAEIIGTAEEIKAILTKFGGGNLDNGIKKMKENAQKLNTEKFPEAPERIDMPVIQGTENLKKVINTIAAGKMDILPPFSPEVKSLLPTLKKENYVMSLSTFKKQRKK